MSVLRFTTPRELEEDLMELHSIKTDLLLAHLRTPAGSSDERQIAATIADCEVEILRREELLSEATGRARVLASPVNVHHEDEDHHAIARMSDEGCPWD